MDGHRWVAFRRLRPKALHKHRSAPPSAFLMLGDTRLNLKQRTHQRFAAKALTKRRLRGEWLWCA